MDELPDSAVMNDHLLSIVSIEMKYILSHGVLNVAFHEDDQEFKQANVLKDTFYPNPIPSCNKTPRYH